jgi:hypothetical protein
VEHRGLTPDSPCTIDLIASLEELRHNETYKFYEILEDLFPEDHDLTVETGSIINAGKEFKDTRSHNRNIKSIELTLSDNEEQESVLRTSFKH